MLRLDIILHPMWADFPSLLLRYAPTNLPNTFLPSKHFSKSLNWALYNEIFFTSAKDLLTKQMYYEDPLQHDKVVALATIVGYSSAWMGDIVILFFFGGGDHGCHGDPCDLR